MALDQDRSSEADDALLDLLQALRDGHYRFTTITPASHARVLARPERQRAESLEDVFGWSLPFAPDLLPAAMQEALRGADAIREEEGLCRSGVRVSSLGDQLFLHSAYPTEDADAVFFGPDSYRFAALIRGELEHAPPPEQARILDIGCGSGVGGILAKALCPSAEVMLSDINHQALRLARVNARANGCAVTLAKGAGCFAATAPLDIALCNPPYMADEAGRAYRDGGDLHGGRLSIDLAAEAVDRLAPDGRLILYTGSAIVRGRDEIRAALEALAARAGCTLDYREIDPDVFGEELDQPLYRDVDRIALVAAVIRRTRS